MNHCSASENQGEQLQYWGERDDCQKTIAQPWGVFTLSGQFLFINTYNSSPVTKFGTKHLVWTPKDIQITILSEYAVSQRVAEQCRLTLHKRTKWLYSTAVLKRQMSMPSIVNIKTNLDQPHVWVPDQGIVLVLGSWKPDQPKGTDCGGTIKARTKTPHRTREGHG